MYTHACSFCLWSLSSRESPGLHREICLQNQNQIISVPFRALVCLPGFLLFSFSLNCRLSSFSKTPLKPCLVVLLSSGAWQEPGLRSKGTWVLTDFMMMNNQYLILLSFSFLLYQAKTIIIVINTIIDFLWRVIVCLPDEVYVDINMFFR